MYMSSVGIILSYTHYLVSKETEFRLIWSIDYRVVKVPVIIMQTGR
jgi:hypothetical protein